MDNKERGLYAKYNVERTDGQELGTCFVLELKDELARPALLVWAHTLEREGYHELAKDIYAALESFESTERLAKDVVITDKDESRELARTVFEDPKFKQSFKQAVLEEQDAYWKERGLDFQKFREENARRVMNISHPELPFDEKPV